MEHEKGAIVLFLVAVLLGFIAACGGIAVALVGGYKIGSVLCAAATGWWALAAYTLRYMS